jgi:hypothetical protein
MPDTLEVFGLCTAANVRDAAWIHDQIIQGQEAEINRLHEELTEASAREARAGHRLMWLLGEENDV